MIFKGDLMAWESAYQIVLTEKKKKANQLESLARINTSVCPWEGKPPKHD